MEFARLQKLLDGMNVEELKKHAKDNKVDVSAIDEKSETAREQLYTAILDDAWGKLDPEEKRQVETARLAEAEKQDRQAAASRGAEPNQVRDEIVKFNTLFCRDLPQAARVGGFTVDKGDERFGGDYDIPNGTYRMAGGEWLYTFKGGKFTGADRASQQNKWGGDKVVQIDG